MAQRPQAGRGVGAFAMAGVRRLSGGDLGRRRPRRRTRVLPRHRRRSDGFRHHDRGGVVGRHDRVALRRRREASCPSIAIHDGSTALETDPEFPFVPRRSRGIARAARSSPPPRAGAAKPLGFAVNVNVKFRGKFDVNLDAIAPLLRLQRALHLLNGRGTRLRRRVRRPPDARCQPEPRRPRTPRPSVRRHGAACSARSTSPGRDRHAPASTAMTVPAPHPRRLVGAPRI